MTNEASTIPLLLEPEKLDQLISQNAVIVIDLSKPDNYNKYHIPGARALAYEQLVEENKPIMGLVPALDKLINVLQQLGISNDSHVVAYDDEGGGKAARLLWTLDLLNHKHFSLLNGGIFSWANEGFALSSETSNYSSSQYQAQLNPSVLADKKYILDHLNSDELILLDARSAEEYQGIKKFAARGGHIPGAVNLDWVETMDKNNNLKLKPNDTLLELFHNINVTKDKEIISYCQTHHRSSHTYFVLKYLGFEKIKGYPGAWSDWGNDPSTPIE